MLQRSILLGLFGLFCFLLPAQNPDWNWSPAGPIYTAGRARNLIVDKNDASGATLYTGSSTSGIFKTTDEGHRWHPLDDQNPVQNISYLAQAHNGTIYAATGEGFLRLEQKVRLQPGTGLYKLVNDQLELVESAVTIGTVITRVTCHPSLDIIALASNKGIFVSKNGGAFQQVPDVPGEVQGMDVDFDANGILYCAIGNETGSTISGINTGTVAGKVFKSSDASLVHFVDITPNHPSLSPSNYGRIELAVSSSDNNVVYVACANKNVSTPNSLSFDSPTLKALFVTYNASDPQPNWSLVQQFSSQLDPSTNGSNIASGDYALCMQVEPNNPDQLYIGSYALYVYKKTGGSQSNPVGTWYRAGQNSSSTLQSFLHENIHDIKIIDGTPRKFYFVTDAGIYRSLDFSNTDQLNQPSFQRFYKGFSTGQFNSVSIERFPLSDSTTETTPGAKVKPYSGFIGGTNGNGFVYYSGRDTLVSVERNYAPDIIYNAEYSKISSGACFMTSAGGSILRSTDARLSAPALLRLATHRGSLSTLTNTMEAFSSQGYSTGTPFCLWENYGQRKASPDSLIFYNDTSQAAAPSMSYNDLLTRRSFSFSLERPGKNRHAQIDSIVVRTATIVLPAITPSITDVEFTTGQNITITLPKQYSIPTTTAVITGSNLITTGPVNDSLAPVIKLNTTTLTDQIIVNFKTPPFASETQTSSTLDRPAYYRALATVFYRYKAKDTIHLVDNSSISVKAFSYEIVLDRALHWNYNALPTYTLSAPVQTSIPNPTFVLTPGNIKQSSPVFVVQPKVKTNYVITQNGSYSSSMVAPSYTISANPITYTISAVIPSSVSPSHYTLSAVPDPFISNSSYSISPAVGVLSQTMSNNPNFIVAPATPTSYTITQSGTGTPSLFISTFNHVGGYTFVLNPGNISQSNKIFTVSPLSPTNYTISQLGSSAAIAPLTYSSISTSTYILNPGTFSQSNPTFVVTPTIAITYTLQSISSNTLSAPSSRTLMTFLSTKTSSPGIGTGSTVPFSTENPYIKTGAWKSARLAFALNNSITNFKPAVVVSRSPLALNDPMEVIRVSQSGCYTDDASGNPTTATISIVGKAAVIEWSKSGTELYFATDSNKLYRVSHITDIFDLSSTCYRGKFLTDVFTFTNNLLNPATPYRTTLIGTFDKPITSISVSNDDQHLALTFHPKMGSTTGNVLYNTTDARYSDVNTINWTDKGSILSNSISAIYCSMMEKDDSRKVFIGTDRGVLYSSDIVSGNWINVNDNATTGKLPYVQVFDIEQQNMDAWDCYNSGQIYIATNGRGVWINKAFFAPYTVGIEEIEAPKAQTGALRIYPNPANEKVTVHFDALDGEKAVLTVTDMTGQEVKQEVFGRLNTGEVEYDLNISDLNAGLYLLCILGDVKVKRVAKLIVTH